MLKRPMTATETSPCFSFVISPSCGHLKRTSQGVACLERAMSACRQEVGGFLVPGRSPDTGAEERLFPIAPIKP